jgi:hypothetical protein
VLLSITQNPRGGQTCPFNLLFWLIDGNTIEASRDIKVVKHTKEDSSIPASVTPDVVRKDVEIVVNTDKAKEKA